MYCDNIEYLFIRFVKLEVESGIELGSILSGALQYVDGASDT